MLFFEYVTLPQKNCEEVVFLNAALPSDLLIPQINSENYAADHPGIAVCPVLGFDSASGF